jgi:hypothetical protein
MAAVQRNPRAALHSFRAEVTDLHKFAVLNYIAVIKAVKKRNRHLGAKLGAAVRPMRAVELLNQQYFYISPKLAVLATQGEILMQVCVSLCLCARARVVVSKCACSCLCACMCTYVHPAPATNG